MTMANADQPRHPSNGTFVSNPSANSPAPAAAPNPPNTNTGNGGSLASVKAAHAAGPAKAHPEKAC